MALNEGLRKIYDDKLSNDEVKAIINNAYLISLLDDDYLKLNGSNANTNIDINYRNLKTTGTLQANTFKLSDTQLFYDFAGDLIYQNLNEDADLFFSVNDGGTTVTMLQVDASQSLLKIGGNTEINGNATSNGYYVNATIDHQIINSSDDLIIKNLNQNKSIDFSVNDSGTQYNALSINGEPNTVGTIAIDGGTRSYGSGAGVMIVNGKASSVSIVADVMSMNMEHQGSSGSAIIFNNNVTKTNAFTDNGSLEAIRNNLGGFTLSTSGKTGYHYGMNNNFGSITLSNGANYIGYGVYNNFPFFFHPSGNGNYNRYGFYSASNSALASAGTVSYKNWGVYLTGYGNLLQNIGTATVTNNAGAIYSDGGDWVNASDNSKIKLGATQDVEIYYNNTELVIDDTTTQLINIQDNDLITTGNIDAVTFSVNGSAGASGTFTTTDSKTVTVTNGIITSIV